MQLTAQVPTPKPKARPEDIGRSAEFYLWVGVLLGVILLGAMVISVAARYCRRAEASESVVLRLSDYRAMLERGEITEAEYELIRAKLGGTMKGELGIQRPATPPPHSE